MGCDIHLAVEVRDGSGWQRAEPFEPNPYARFVDEPAEVRQRWYHDRNYRLFAMLADVRNGRGTAGVDTGDRLIPIDEPRGLPDDVSKEVYEDSAKWGVDGHSHSHFTLAELLAVDWWGTESVNRGWVDPPRDGWGRFKDEADWLAWTTRALAGGYYSASISGGVGGQSVVAKHLDGTVTLGDTARSSLFRGRTPVATAETKPTVYEVEWRCSWAQDAGANWFQLLARMGGVMVARGVSPQNVRIVFWFDN